MNTLTLVKMIHTLIWIFFNIVIFYLAYAVIIDKIDWLVWLCISLIIAEGIVLLAFKGFCPLTIIARKHSNSTRDNFDIYLPEWLARHNKVIYTSTFIAVIALLIYRLAT